MSFTLSASTSNTTTSSGSSLATASTINCPAGSLIVVASRWESGGSSDSMTATVTDTDGNTYINAGYAFATASQSTKVGLWYTLSAGGEASNTMTWTLSSGNRSYRSIHALCYTYDNTAEFSSASNHNGTSSLVAFDTDSTFSTTSTGLTIGVVGAFNSAKLPATWDHALTSGTLQGLSEVAYKLGAYSTDFSGSYATGQVQAVIAANFEDVASGPTIDTAPSAVTRGETGVTLAGTEFGSTQGSSTLEYGNDTVGWIALTVDTWADTLLTFDIPSALALQHDATGYKFKITVV